MLEQFPPRNSGPVPRRIESAPPPASLEDYVDTPEIHSKLLQLPVELRAAHIRKVEDLSDEDAVAYLNGVLEKRESALRESMVSDDSIREYFTEHGEDIWKSLETNIFSDTENLIGRGTTARIKRFSLESEDEDVPKSLAIKYLVTPTEKTLSVSGEHDLIREVERIQKIEEDESMQAQPIEYIRVPHPYFYYRHGKIQCYGMQEIDGINLLQGVGGIDGTEAYDSDLKEEFVESLTGIDRIALMDEVDRFFDTMHETCLHGDIKPANLMISREGRFYVIDFGQSVLATSIDEKSGPNFENLKEDEKKQAKMAISNFLTKLGV